MAYTVTYNLDLGVIETKAEGKLTFSEAKEIIAAIVQTAIEKNCFLCLSDYREATLEMSTLQIHDLPNVLSNILTSRGLHPSQFKRAVVAHKGWRDYYFFESVTLNAAQHIRLFQQVDEAQKWLLGK